MRVLHFEKSTVRLLPVLSPIIVILGCTSYYKPKNPAEVREKCGNAPWASSEAIGYDAKQEEWNDCAEQLDNRIAREGKSPSEQSRVASNQVPAASQRKPEVGGVPNPDPSLEKKLAVTEPKVENTAVTTPTNIPTESQEECHKKALEAIEERHQAWAQKVLDECPKTRLPHGTYQS